MPNAREKIEGETTFEVDGKIYRMALSTNAIVELEDELDANIVDIGNRMMDPKGVRIGLARSVFRAALIEYQPDTTHQDAGRMMDKLGPVRSLELVAEAMQAAFPEVDAAGPLEGNRKARRRASSGRRS